MEIGLRYWNGSAVVEIPVLTDYANYELRITKNGTVYGIPTVAVSSPDALPIRVKLPSGIEALGYTVPIIPPTVEMNSITLWAKNVYRNWFVIYSTVNVVDAITSLPLSGVSVTVSWTGLYTAFQTGSTDGSGNVSFSTPWVARGYQTITITDAKIGGVSQPLTGILTKTIGV